jgi:hypothetical protein
MTASVESGIPNGQAARDVTTAFESKPGGSSTLMQDFASTGCSDGLDKASPVVRVVCKERS